MCVRVDDEDDDYDDNRGDDVVVAANGEHSLLIDVVNLMVGFLALLELP